MTDTPKGLRRRADTSKARRAAAATYARRRHAAAAEEMRPYGVIVIFTDKYTGHVLPLDQQPPPPEPERTS